MCICVTSATQLHGSGLTSVVGREAFLADKMIQDAVIRNLEVIGEAVKNLSSDLRDQHPDIPWTRIAGMGCLDSRVLRCPCRNRLGGSRSISRAQAINRLDAPPRTGLKLIITVYEFTDE